jgi:integrase
MRGHVRPRGKEPNQWHIVLDLPRGPDGKRRQKWHRFNGTKRKAEAECARLVHELTSGAYIEPTKLTTGQFLVEWLEGYGTSLGPKTREGYADFINGHLMAELGAIPLASLQPVHIQRYKTKALSEGRKDGSGGLSNRTVAHHLRVLRLALKHAVGLKLIGENPAEGITRPKPVAKEMRVLDAAESAHLLTTARGHALYVLVAVALSTGLRRGELLALRWSDLDLERDPPALRVQRAAVFTRAGGLEFRQPKTKKSRRTVPLPASIVPVLLRHKGAQAEKRLALGPAYEDQGLVFAREDGKPLSLSAVSQQFLGLRRRAGLNGLRFHDLRHTHATQLLLANVNPKVVSERLGHASIGITLDTYSHVLPTMQNEAARHADQALRAALGL